MSNIYSRILGTLYGVALGDSMGMPTEMLSRDQIKDYYGWVNELTGKGGKNGDGYSAGEITDDTMNTLFLVDVLIENNGKIDSEKFINKVREWLITSSKGFSVTGPSTKAAIENINQGMDITVTGKNGTTNGAAMKIAPIGILYSYENLEILVDKVYDICMPTHNTKTAVSGAAAIAAAVSYGVYGGDDLNELLEIAKNAAILGCKKGYDVFAPSISKRIDLVKQIIDNAKSPVAAIESIYDIIGTGLPTSETVPVALGMVYLAKGNVSLCSQYCANIGGDTDTIGAIACAICGAIGGAEQFNITDIQKIEQVNEINFVDRAYSLEKIRTALNGQ